MKKELEGQEKLVVYYVRARYIDITIEEKHTAIVNFLTTMFETTCRFTSGVEESITYLTINIEDPSMLPDLSWFDGMWLEDHLKSGSIFDGYDTAVRNYKRSQRC